ncbi:amino acid permease [Apilactobacillus timberlakei]|uniref:Amino acid permease n=1 Tax=Apilactobacillus timberlakei TaxID=2008380 RepID=A0ABY2YTC1_9LACO|nr:amino acid permease [Apilactobacillus timberlakei]TPR13296.1 amino acid permease [Apilactobacillus timberlakei]TPR14341.1 amino acid permease [Apilactobacillus timberlakei]TPR16594.1 amino acid permease [Apilactobacillus timberlakei]
MKASKDLNSQSINSDGTKRTLSNRHVQMIAIGGTIGTGLFLGSGTTISQTGPSILLIYALMGLVFFFMMRAIGEMLYASPQEHTFVAFITKYLGMGAGIFAGWSYWFAIIFGGMAELTAIAIYVKFWFPTWNSAIIQIVFLLALTGINVLAARVFGEAEFWFATIKIIAIVSLILVGLFMVFAGFKDSNGAMASFSNLTNNFTFFPNGKVAFISAIPMVFFAFLAMEFVSITIGETKNPREVLKKAINQTVYRILIFYIGALLVIMFIIPWREISPNNSPFVQVFKLAGLPAAAAIINFVVLTSAASSLNSLIFSSGRHLYQLSMEQDGKIIKHFRQISKAGVPANAIRMSASLFLFAPIISLVPTIKNSFEFVGAAGSDLYIFVYILTMLAHRKYKASDDYLTNGFKMPLYKISSPIVIFAFAFIFVTLFFNPNDVIPAIGAIIWLLLFGTFCIIKNKGKKPVDEI